MKLSDIKTSGEGASRLIKVVENIKTITNTYVGEYDTALSSAKALFANPELTFSIMSEAQINTFWLNGLGNILAIATAKEVITEWELCILQVKSSANKFINDI